MKQQTDDGRATKSAATGQRRRRFSRADSERSEPIRDWWNLLRPSESGATPWGGPSSAPGNRNLSSVVDRGVKLGYKVIDDQIRQGQRVAQEINTRTYGGDSMNRDFQELAMRSMRYYVDAASLFMDFMGTIPASVGLGMNSFGQRTNGAANEKPNDGPAQGAASPPASAVRVATRIVSARPATVTVDLQPASVHRPLAVPNLVSAGKDTLTDVAFEPAAAGGAPVVSVKVPEGQPAGLYSGVAFDPDSGEPRGTITVRIDP